MVDQSYGSMNWSDTCMQKSTKPNEQILKREPCCHDN